MVNAQPLRGATYTAATPLLKEDSIEVLQGDTILMT
jgi:hypothetical protein